MNEIVVYNTFSKYLKERFGERVYKLPVNLPLTCPNRDGFLSRDGCVFCGEEGGTFEDLSHCKSVEEQLLENKSYIGKRYKAKKFIAYFQNFSNTYLPIDKFKEYINNAIMEDIVGISVSTRPDCINDEYLEFLQGIKENHNLDITIELGLQTVNYHSLAKINRCHSLAEFIDAVIGIKRYGLRICAHLILNLPWDNILDTIENAKVLSSLKIDEIKLHALYVVKETKLGYLYENEEIDMISKDEYIERVITFLEYLDPSIVVQRIIGRAPSEGTLFVNWDQSWWKIRDEIVSIMETNKTYQGRKFNYLNGKALKKFKKI